MMARPRSVDVNGDTRERILAEAARLFSELGYHGASTRAITEAVGIKQPSLFHYFAGKEAIGQELIDRRVTMSPLLSDRFVPTPDDPALDLFRLIRDETTVELEMSLDTRWLFRLPPATSELFPRWEATLAAATATTEHVIRRGIESGDFIAEHPRVVREIFDAVANESMFWPHDTQGLQPEVIAKVLLRLVITDASTIAAVAERAKATAPLHEAPTGEAPTEEAPTGEAPTGEAPTSEAG
ncbi:TetR/AcrR family transcriptional regulator [Brevibacterium casei]|uniref:TetR/AcrR family transcriptional regulator n=1 Tax=Brevibacterium casei TaxID=33889 RepID=UPI00370100B3